MDIFFGCKFSCFLLSLLSDLPFHCDIFPLDDFCLDSCSKSFLLMLLVSSVPISRFCFCIAVYFSFILISVLLLLFISSLFSSLLIYPPPCSSVAVYFVFLSFIRIHLCHLYCLLYRLLSSFFLSSTFVILLSLLPHSSSSFCPLSAF